jgi:hypothetical protein
VSCKLLCSVNIGDAYRLEYEAKVDHIW